MFRVSRLLAPILPVLLSAITLFVSACSTPPSSTQAPATQPLLQAATRSNAGGRVSTGAPVMLGIDVLEASGFAAVRGKRVGLLTHPAGVNRRGELTIDVLRRAPQTKLAALFAPEHGLYGTEKASASVEDTVDRRTGLPVYSLHGKNRKPSEEQLRGLDALVIDLQDIGVRSYTFNVVMRYAMDACFLHGVEVIVLDRPNPLGGLKVDGPSLNREWMSGVGAFPIPYIHGLTMAELARLAASEPGVLDIPEAARLRGRLTIVPMRGWRRAMRWPQTGLTFVPTSTYIRDFAAVVGYATAGLGCEYSGFKHGIGTPYPFRLLSFNGKTADQLQRDLNALRLPGLRFRKLATNGARGRPADGVYIEVTDWNAWNPTELSFHLMRLACRYDPPNPFATLTHTQARSFNIHAGSTAWWRALNREGARVDVETWIRRWHTTSAVYQQQTRKYWLYN